MLAAVRNRGPGITTRPDRASVLLLEIFDPYFKTKQPEAALGWQPVSR
jgi:hypothetical protein